MADTQEPKSGIPHDEPNAPIEIYFGRPTLDFGVAAIPKLLSRFWIHLSSDGEQLVDWEYAILLQVLMLRDTQDYELRPANLPVRSKLSSIERLKAKLRRMGLVFTERMYYATQPGQMPKMRAQRWDVRSLFYNLEQIGQVWLLRQKQIVDSWEMGGKKGGKPVYNFSVDYLHEVGLPPDVALDIVREVFFPIPLRWREISVALLSEMPTAHHVRGTVQREDLSTAHLMRGTLPTTREMRGANGFSIAQELRGRQPIAHPMRGHLLEDEEDEEEETTALAEKIFSYFADRKGEVDYRPSTKEKAALDKLLADGFLYDQIIAGIDEAYMRPNKPRHFTYCAAITRDMVRYQQESPFPGSRTQPETQAATALQEPEMPGEETPLVIDADLTRAVEVYRSAGRQVTADLLARFRLMVARCDRTARSAGSSGGNWLAEAVTSGLGVAKPENLLNYADAVLSDWITNGHGQRPAKTPRQRKSSSKGESGVHQGIRDYLEKRGGIPNGR